MTGTPESNCAAPGFRQNLASLARLTLLALGALSLTLTGCRSIGPATVKRDRMHYSFAVAESWKEQLLLNIVKGRYGDSPAFMEISSVVAGYTLETGLGVNGQYSPPSLSGDTFVGGEISGTFTDRPTITYLPMTGEKFARSLMAPVPLDALWSVIQGGAPADFLLGLTVQSFQGLRNFGIYAGHFQPTSPEFARVLQLLGSLQQAHALDSGLTKAADRYEVYIHFRSPSLETELSALTADLKRLLRIPADTNQVRVVSGTWGSEPGTIQMRTRSLMQILSALGAGVQIPEQHLKNGGVVVLDSDQVPSGFVVKSGREKPKHAFVSVPYQDHWFWIEDSDLPSKTTLGAVTFLFNFLEGGGTKAAPVLTIPTN